MTDEEIKKIAEDYVKSNIPNGIDEEYARCVVFHDSEMFGRFLQWISKYYCIVPKAEILNQHAWYMQRMKEVSVNKQLNLGKALALENLFGKEMFEEDKK